MKEYGFDSLMRNFSFVFQSVYLFEDTIANNIRFGEPDAPMSRVIEAAKKAKCHDFITALPDGYDTVIGEGGASLSGGEKQRISIARAIMKDAPIIILDEATANVDPENEAELTAAIEELTKEKTIIMIAHRLKTVRHADRIFVIDDGRIAQAGTHDELMKEDGIYRRFVEGRREAVSWKIGAQGFAMTLIGILGCMVLLVGGLGMRDTMAGFLDLLDNKVSHYTTKVNLVDNVGYDEAQYLIADLDGDWESLSGISLDGDTVTLDILHLEKKMISVIDEKNREIDLSDEGVYLCLRLKDRANDVKQLGRWFRDKNV